MVQTKTVKIEENAVLSVDVIPLSLFLRRRKKKTVLLAFFKLKKKPSTHTFSLWADFIINSILCKHFTLSIYVKTLDYCVGLRGRAIVTVTR